MSYLNKNFEKGNELFGCCGIDCGKCTQYPTRCEGCNRPGNNCPIRDCCNAKGIAHCGHCPELPCERYYDGVNAIYSEGYERSIKDRALFKDRMNER